MVSLIQNILTKNLETLCQVVLTKTCQKMIVNLLMMVFINLPIKFTCQHHVSGYVCHVWRLDFFFLLLIEILSIAKLLIIVHFFVLKHEKQTLCYIHTKSEGDKNILFCFLFLQFTLWEHLFFCPTLKLHGPERLMPLKLLGMNRVKVAYAGLVEHRLCPTLAGSMSATSFLHYHLFLLVNISTTHTQKNPKKSEYMHGQKIYHGILNVQQKVN